MTTPNMNKLDSLTDILTRLKSGCPLDPHDDDECGLTVAQARSAILKLVREMMPERKYLNGENMVQPMCRPTPMDGETVTFTHINYDERRGFNKAIDLIESKLKEIE